MVTHSASCSAGSLAAAAPGASENGLDVFCFLRSAGQAAIEAKRWEAAIGPLSSAALRDTRNADIQNYLGYAYHRTGQLELAFKHYGRALELNPRHRGAHEYEAYLMVDNLAKAEVHLASLKGICLIPCEEYEDLKKAIAAYRRRTGKGS